MSRPADDTELRRRQFLAGSAATLLAACRVMSEVRASDHLIRTAHPAEWNPVLVGLVTTVLPFEHPAFPALEVADIHRELMHLFPIADAAEYASLRNALTLFNDVASMDVVPAPLVEEERRDMTLSRVPVAQISPAMARSISDDRSRWRTFAQRFGQAAFVDQSLDARRAYLSLWGASEFIARRRFYRGVKTIIAITACSMKPFWTVVGYEGPLLRQG